jgi:DNA-binding CsgD family transcriptional regulator
MMKGMTSTQIAEELIISVSTVKTLRSRIFKKLGVETMNEAPAVVSKFHLI